MDDLEALTYELASAILQCEAACFGTQPRTSVKIAAMILQQVLPHTLVLGEVGSPGNISPQ